MNLQLGETLFSQFEFKNHDLQFQEHENTCPASDYASVSIILRHLVILNSATSQIDLAHGSVSKLFKRPSLKYCRWAWDMVRQLGRLFERCASLARVLILINHCSCTISRRSYFLYVASSVEKLQASYTISPLELSASTTDWGILGIPSALPYTSL